MTLKSRSTALAGAVLAFGFLGSFEATPLHAQTRPAIIRDQDNPALAPFTASVSFSLTAINMQQLLTTVPAGKRLVIEYASYLCSGASSDQLIFLAVRSAQFGQVVNVFQINPPHASASAGFTLQDGSTPMKAYFEAGQQVWVSASHTNNAVRDMQVYVTGYYITP